MTEEKDRSLHDEGGAAFVSKKYKLAEGNKGIIIVIVVVALILLGEFLIVKYFPKQSFLPNPFSQKSPTPKYQAQIDITDQGFTPATLLVKKGTQINWVVSDTKLHQIAADPHPLHNLLPALFQSQPSQNSYSYTFIEEGTYTYHDEVNPLKFHGTVIVK